MTIEIMRSKSIYVYRVNPYNGRIIDRKRNAHRARWQWFATYQSEALAREAVLQLEKEGGGETAK